MDEPYRIEVLHIVNPHLIFVESVQKKGTPVIQQIGIYGILPVHKTIDIDGEIIATLCENWPVAANTIMREFLAEHKRGIYFVPIHVDERTTIFDENGHQFGDIIVQDRTTKSITNHLTDFAVALKDEAAFHRKLASGSLKLKLNTARTEEVLEAIEKYYKNQKKLGHEWQKTLQKQTTVHQETKKITALTKENLRLFERTVQGSSGHNGLSIIEQKEKDLDLCRDVDLVPLGRGSRRDKSSSVNADEPHEVFAGLKQYLVTHGERKDSDTTSNKMRNHSTPKKDAKLNDTKNTSQDSDLEWDDDDNVKTQKQEALETFDRKQYIQNKEQIKNIYNKDTNEVPRCHHSQETPQVQSMKYADENRPENCQVKPKPCETAVDKSKKKESNLTQYEKSKGAPRNTKKISGCLKPRERRMVYCPDMELNNTNTKDLISIVVAEDSAANFANSSEEVPKKDANDQSLNVSDKLVKDKSVDDANSGIGNSFDKNISCDVSNNNVVNNSDQKDSHSNLQHSVKISPVTNTRIRLNTSLLQRKLLALQTSHKTDEANSSNSDDSKKEPDGKTVTKSFHLDTTETEMVSHPEVKATKHVTKEKRVLSSKTLQKRLQLQIDLKNRNETSSSTSDTSVKDTSSAPDEPDLAKSKPKPVKIQPKLAENVPNIERNVNPFKNLDGSKSIFVERLVSPILMVHTKNNNLILPQCELRDIPFKEDIQMMLKSMRVHRPKRLQMVTWPYILRGHSMFIIGPAGNGKTVGYVPAICNLVVDSASKFDGVGPICIIVCATALSVSEVEVHCKRFLSVEERIVTFYSGIDPTKTMTALLNGCHVLICTAPALVYLLETDFGVDMRRLATLVLDDCERLSQVYTTDLTKIIQNVKLMLKNRTDKVFKVQYVLASRQWCDFMTPLAKKAPNTVIAIGASQECVLYSKTKTSVKFVKSQTNKVNAVVEFLDEIDRSKRTVIVCREDDEVTELEKAMTKQNRAVFACNNTMNLHDLCRLNELWANYEEPVSGPILICCDGNLTHMNVTNANYLVHYSLPALFSTFCKRFSVLNENYASIFGPEKDDVKIKILLDETNVEQLPKIMHFVKRCSNEEFPTLDNIMKQVLEARDLKKAENLNPICNGLLMLGECADTWNCSDRHTVFNLYDEPKDWIPKNGVITFNITHFDSAVTYSARVLAKLAKDGPVKYPNNYNTLSLKMGMHYSKEINRKLHGVPKVGDVCAVALKPNFFERCRVMKVIPGDTKNINHVLINLIEEEQMTVVSDVLLYHLPDEFKAIETHVVKIRLANIQPKDKDVTFSLTAKKHLQEITDPDREHGLYMRGQVVMALGNTIFVDTAEACVDLSSLGETIVKRDFKKELLDRHAEPNLQHLKKLKKICAEINTNIDVAEPTVVPKVRKSPKWAHLDKDDFSRVFFAAVVDAGTIFVRHAKFENLTNSLMKDIKEYVKDTPEIDRDEIYVGNFVLAEFPDDATYERARIEEIVNDKIVNCFFVDNGDWRQVFVEKLRPISESIMRRIPFQAIECRLIGVKPPGNADTWPEFSTCWLDENCFEDKDGNQKQLFAKYFTKETAKVTGGHKYSVVLFDTYSGKDVVINKAMIELNLAKVIEEEEKYINEPLNIKRVKVTDSSSVSDDDVSVNDDSRNSDIKQSIEKALVPTQHQENSKNEGNDIPLHILLGQPIRSVPLINSDSDSDISDKWDVNVDKELLGMFGQPSKANITEHKDTKDEKKDNINSLKNNSTATNKSVENTETTKPEPKEVSNNDTTNENILDSIDSVASSDLKIDKSRSNQMSPALDSDDIDIDDDRIKALDIFKSKMFKIDETKKITSKHTEDKEIETTNNDLDSDDLSSAMTDLNESNDKNQLRKPKLVWRQNKTSVVIKINLIGVEDYTIEIKERGMFFKSWHNDTNYEFNIELYGVIVTEKSVHSNKGQYIQVKLVKLMSRNWLNLTRDFSTKKWIVYDVDAIDLSSDDEDDDGDEARKVIKHNHEKADSSSDDDDFVDDLNFTYKKH